MAPCAAEVVKDDVARGRVRARHFEDVDETAGRLRAASNINAFVDAMMLGLVKWQRPRCLVDREMVMSRIAKVRLPIREGSDWTRAHRPLESQFWLENVQIPCSS